MRTSVHPDSLEPLAVRRIGASVWIVRLLESLELRAVPALRNAFRDAIERNANDVVVDFATAEAVSSEGAAALAEMADVMRGRGGALWIAAPKADGDGYMLRPVRKAEPNGLAGVSRALDSALGGVAA